MRWKPAFALRILIQPSVRILERHFSLTTREIWRQQPIATGIGTIIGRSVISAENNDTINVQSSNTRWNKYIPMSWPLWFAVYIPE